MNKGWTTDYCRRPLTDLSLRLTNEEGLLYVKTLSPVLEEARNYRYMDNVIVDIIRRFVFDSPLE